MLLCKPNIPARQWNDYFIFFRFRPSQFTVKLGEWDLKDSDIYSQEFRIVEITAHPDFKANGFYNDVAIFKLDQPAYFNE